MEGHSELPKFEDLSSLRHENNNDILIPPLIPQRINVNMHQNPAINYNPLMQSYPSNFLGNTGNYGLFNQNYNMYSGQGMDNQLMGSFSSINNAVQSFNALNMLVNTAYGALYTSISTLANASEQFSRTKTQLVHILSTINIFKMFKRFISYLKKILSGQLRPTMADVTSLLGEVTRTFTSSDPGSGGHFLSALFFITIVCGPIIIYKYIRNTSMTKSSQITAATKSAWNSQIGKSYAAKVKTDFFKRNADELTVRAGEIVTIAPPEYQKEVNWYLVSNLRCEQGVVPASFVTVMGLLDKSKNQKETE